MNRTQRALSNIGAALAVAIGLFYFAVHMAEWRGRQDLMHHDQYNYIDVARHVLAGDGLVQSALGFNQPRGVTRYGSFPSPFEAQPPLFPLLIAAGASLPGVELYQSALLLPTLAHLGLCVVAYLIGLQLRDARSGAMAAALTLVSLEARALGSSPYSETTGILFYAGAFALMLRAVQSAPRSAETFAAGLLAGLGVATRYVLLAFVIFGLLVLLLVAWRRKTSFAPAAAFALGAGMVVAPVLIHNLATIGSLLPQPLPSTRSLVYNALDTIKALEYYWLLAAALALCGLLLGTFARGRRARFLHGFFVARGAWLIWCWVAFFMAYVIAQRSLTHFNIINLRFLFPITTLLTIAFAVYLCDVLFQPLPWTSNLFAAGLCALAAIQYMFTSPYRAPVTQDQVKSLYPEVRWLADNTTQRDLIVGIDTPHIPLYSNRTHVISISAYPYTEQLDHPTLTRFLNARCSTLDRALVYVEHRVFRLSSDWVGEFGQFWTDLHLENVSAYPNVRLLDRDARFTYYALEACG